jgi:hypothetical protein
MGMSTHAVGFIPADEEWEKMKRALNACQAAAVPIPAEVCEFFGDENPNDKPGREVSLAGALSEYSDDSRQGFEIDVAKLPKNVKVIRFFNSY